MLQNRTLGRFSGSLALWRFFTTAFTLGTRRVGVMESPIRGTVMMSV